MTEVATVWLLLIVYVPIPPEPDPSAVITVPDNTPMPNKDCPTAIVPEVTAETVITVPAIVAVTTAPTVAEFMTEVATVWLLLIVYVPIPPEPDPSAVITVPDNTPMPNKDCPTAIVPLETLATVNVVPLVEPVNTADAGLDMYHV